MASAFLYIRVRVCGLDHADPEFARFHTAHTTSSMSPACPGFPCVCHPSTIPSLCLFPHKMKS